MTLYEFLAIGISCIGVGISIISLLKSNSANKISQGQIELSIHQLIQQTQKDVMELSLRIADQEDPEEGKNEILLQVFKTAFEQNLNAYEEACAKYLDGKVDRERFKRNYIIEIRRLVEEYKEKFDSTTTPYKCILKVYKEWNDLEK